MDICDTIVCRYLFNSFVDDNKAVAWCPAPVSIVMVVIKCSNIIETFRDAGMLWNVVLVLDPAKFCVAVVSSFALGVWKRHTDQLHASP